MFSADLIADVTDLAGTTLLARHWPGQGSRHKAALAAAGFLLRREVSVERVERIISEAAREAGDEEWNQRAMLVASTAEKLDDDRPTTGGRSLGALLRNDGEAVVTRLSEWYRADNGKPWLNAKDEDVPKMSAAAWKALQRDNTPARYFSHNGLLSRINIDSHHPAPQALGCDELTSVLARAANWYRPLKAGGGRVPKVPPLHIVRDMLAFSEPPLPVLRGMVRAPAFTAHGDLLLTPGYDPRSGMFLMLSPDLELAAIDPHPTAEALASARRLLEEDLLGDFPFVTEIDRAHAVALLLGPFVRDLIAGPTPLHVLDKPTPGTGATLLTEVIGIIATGEPIEVMTGGGSEEERRKRITATLLGAPPFLLIDNVQHTLHSESLSAALTSGIWRDRVLGASRMCDIRTRTTWLVTGNNVTLSTELARRAVRIRLDAGLEAPHLRSARSFRHPDLRAWVRANRGSLIEAVLTLTQAWIAAGRPIWPPTLGMFESWDEVMGGILRNAGIAGFLCNVQDQFEHADLESTEWGGLVERWWGRHRHQAVGVSDLWPLVDPTATDSVDLHLGNGPLRSQQTKFGQQLRRMRDRVFAGFRIQVAGQRHGALQWRLVSMKSPQTALAQADESITLDALATSVPTHCDEPREPCEPVVTRDLHITEGNPPALHRPDEAAARSSDSRVPESQLPSTSSAEINSGAWCGSPIVGGLYGDCTCTVCLTNKKRFDGSSGNEKPRDAF